LSWLDQLAGLAIVCLIGALALVVLVGVLPAVWVLLARASTAAQRREARACLHQMIQIVVLIVAAIVMLAGGPWSDVLAAGTTAVAAVRGRGGPRG
jgi:Na+-driven multidrug efflux pump